MRIALYQPDIPQNTGTILRMAACLGLRVHVIEPCGFLLDDRRLRRAGLDYLARAVWTRHPSWDAFLAAEGGRGRLVLLSTQGKTRHLDVSWRPDDILVMGRESGGVPESVQDRVDLTARIPMADGERSLNVAVAAALALGEALRQTGGWPGDPPAG